MAIISERIEGKNIFVDVQSSNIKSAMFNTETSELDVTFNNGAIYRYYDVSWETFTKFRMAPSQGAFLNTNVKKTSKVEKLN